jgi:small subunit ribosomal protein S8
MSFSDTIGDMLTRIRNGAKAKLASVTTPHSALRESVLEVLKAEGFIGGFETREVRKGIKEISIELKYHDGESAIKEIKRVSTPGRRFYASSKDIPGYRNGLGIAILSTSSGVMAGYEARRRGVGGEILCYVF